MLPRLAGATTDWACVRDALNTAPPVNAARLKKSLRLRNIVLSFDYKTHYGRELRRRD
jgi:hypothetical protein